MRAEKSFVYTESSLALLLFSLSGTSDFSVEKVKIFLWKSIECIFILRCNKRAILAVVLSTG
jgi:hypothetical protein